jgi:hypothetical protein
VQKQIGVESDNYNFEMILPDTLHYQDTAQNLSLKGNSANLTKNINKDEIISLKLLK